MNISDYIFYGISILTVLSAIAVVVLPNPVYSALFLALTMVGVAGLFVTLDALFLAGVQLIVYAGAVIVLFVMVLMLFDLKQELRPFTKGVFSGVLKLGSVGVLSGIIVGTFFVADQLFQKASPAISSSDTTIRVGTLLFTQYVLGFEILGVLLLIVAIGAVALSRSRGGTHGKL